MRVSKQALQDWGDLWDYVQDSGLIFETAALYLRPLPFVARVRSPSMPDLILDGFGKSIEEALSVLKGRIMEHEGWSVWAVWA